MAFDLGKPLPSVVPFEETKISQEPKALKFSDFDILQLLGEGSFGKVFKVKKRDTGIIYAMKSMSKKQLIQNNQVRYAVTEA
jgi:serine/threonine protein kinase